VGATSTLLGVGIPAPRVTVRGETSWFIKHLGAVTYNVHNGLRTTEELTLRNRVGVLLVYWLFKTDLIERALGWCLLLGEVHGTGPW